MLSSETAAQLPATIWTVQTGANVSALPILFVEKYFVLSDMLLFSGTDLSILTEVACVLQKKRIVFSNFVF